MLTLPSPLHPALVHFPIVLILLGAAISILAVLLHRQRIAWLVAGLLAIGSLGAVAAVWSGEKEGELAGELSVVADQALDQHEDWAERTRSVSLFAAALAVATALLHRKPIARAMAALTAVIAVAAAVCVIQTGHRGGQLVYRHGIGINTAPVSATAPALPEKEEHDRD